MKTKVNNKALRAEALRLGFPTCGIASTGPVDPVHRDFLKEWLGSGRHAEMVYMGNHFDKRCDPALLVESTRYVVSVALNYHPTTRLPGDGRRSAWYAYGMDYHDLIHEELTAPFHFIQESDVPELDGRVFCGTAPVLGRYWAWHAGLGWIGKNTQLIIPHAGSTLFLGGLSLNTEADICDRPRPNRCGTCNRCLQACPTQTLGAPYDLDARYCLSYLTMENKGKIPASIPSLIGNRVYGCDEYQKACPWDRFVTPCRIPELQPSPELMNMKEKDWQQLSEEKYGTLFKGNAVEGAKYSGLIRNIKQMKD